MANLRPHREPGSEFADPLLTPPPVLGPAGGVGFDASATWTDDPPHMGTHSAWIAWTRKSADFLQGKYSREHAWTFDGGLTIPASPDPAGVPSPYSNPANVDPEEAFVAAIASCHMLTFLFLASRQGYLVDSYEDHAVGQMTRNERGIPWVSLVTLNPQIVYSGDRQPTPEDEERLHHRAHEQCIIANSVRTEILVARKA